MNHSRRAPFRLFSILLLAVPLSACTTESESLPTVVMYKNPSCGCCGKWAEHLEQAGFRVESREPPDLNAMRETLGMPIDYASCHTAKIGGILVEGHVPAADIKRLLAEQANPASAQSGLVGLSAPGMPQGSPGMETSVPQDYDVLLVRTDGTSSVYQRHPAR